MKKTLLALAMLAASTGLALAQAISVTYTATGDPGQANSGTDQNGNPVTVWSLGTTSGTGFAGSFFGDSSQNGGGGSGNPGSSGAGAGTGAWGLYSGGDSVANAQIDHLFTGGALTAGETVSINLDNGYVNGGGGSVGMRLFGDGGFNFALSFTGGDAVYRYYDGSGSSGSGLLGYTDGGINVSLTLTGASTYNGTITGLTTDAGNVMTWSGTFANGGSPTDIEVYTTDNQGGGAYDFFSNNLSVVPEPSTYAFIFSGFGMLAAFRRMRRK